VIILTGARQTGKSTLITNEVPFSSWRYLSFDDLDVLGMAKRSPQTLLSVKKNTVIDEVQKAPEVLTAIKYIIDKDRKRRFIISGSANLLLMKRVTETLAGRSSYFMLLPFSLKEWHEEKPNLVFKLFKGYLPKEKRFKAVSPLKYIFQGFLPPVLRLDKTDQIATWWEGYVKTYLERDLRDLTAVSSLSDFKRIMEICAIKSGSILNEMDIARSCGMSQSTVHRYINLLEASHLYIRLRPFTKSKIRRIIKSPKGYFLDPGLATYLAGFRGPDEIPPDLVGYLFETLILLHLQIYATLLSGNVYYWRTWGGKEKEVDFILEANQKLIAVEVKLGQKVSYNDIQHLQFFIDNNKNNVVAGIVAYTGDELTYLTKNIFALPWTAFC